MAGQNPCELRGPAIPAQGIQIVRLNGLKYREAFKNGFYTNTTPRTIDVRSVGIRDRGLNTAWNA